MMLQDSATLMSPFLAQIQVINVAGDSSGTAKDPTDAETTAELMASLKALKQSGDLIGARARAQAAEAAKQVKLVTDSLQTQGKAKADATTEDQDAGSVVTVQDGNKSIVVHRHRSNSEDVPFVILPITTVTLVFFYLVVKAIMAPFTQRANKRGTVSTAASRGSRGLSDEEQAILLKLQRTLGQMERRIESLETILIDQSRTKENYGTKL